MVPGPTESRAEHGPPGSIPALAGDRAHDPLNAGPPQGMRLLFPDSVADLRACDAAERTVQEAGKVIVSAKRLSTERAS